MPHGRIRLVAIARKGWPLPLLVIAFLTLGIPRWLAGEGRSATRNGDAIFTRLCHERGGTLVTTPASPSVPAVQRHCVVRYAGNEYVIDAVTPHGWDRDAAALQRGGCEEADRQASTAPRKSRVRFIYHPNTGVCERR
jgi:hypothetical protein